MILSLGLQPASTRCKPRASGDDPFLTKILDMTLL